MFKKIFIAACLSVVWVGLAYAAVDFKGGFAERIRHEFRKNISDLDNKAKDNRNFFRVRTSLWGQVDFNKNLTLYSRLVNENKPYIYWAGASAAAGKSATKKGYRYEIDEVVFDNLYANAKNLFGMPLDLRIGRQDLDTYGEGFLIKEGTPGDGPRTVYFNAAKATWNINTKNSLDFIFIFDPATDDILPVINRIDGGQSLNASDEIAYALYNKSDPTKNLHLENYYIYKQEEGVGATSSARMTRQETKLNTVGSFGQYKFSPWALRGQLAGQLGSYGDNDRTGLGGYVFLDRNFKNFFWTPEFSLGTVYLSGDDLSSAKNEAWDPLFSRWPWMSDLYGLAYGSESEIYYWTNLQMYRLSLAVAPTKKLKFTLRYNFLRANQQVASTAVLFSGTGKNRGHLPQIKLDYAFNKNVSAFFMADYLIPGNFYINAADPALHLKSEIQIKF